MATGRLLCRCYHYCQFNLLFIAVLFVCLIDGSLSLLPSLLFFLSLFSTLVIVLQRTRSLSGAESERILFASFAQEMSRRPYGLVPAHSSRPQKGPTGAAAVAAVAAGLSSTGTWPFLSVTQDFVTCLSCVSGRRRRCPHQQSSSSSSLSTSFIDCAPIRPTLLRDLMQLLLGASPARHSLHRVLLVHLLSPWSFT